MTLNSTISDSELLKIDNFKELDKISKQIKELVKEIEEPDLTLFISNPETNTVKIPFIKKMRLIYQKKKNLFTILLKKKN